MPHLIDTDRLSLHLIEVQDLITLFEDSENQSIYLEKPFRNPHRVLIDNPGPLAWRVPQVKVDPALNIWFVRWIVLKATNEIIGSISFHGKPDESGMIEIGLGIASEFQGKGFGSEALDGMWRWVIAQKGVKTLRYTVSPENLASITLIKKFGFQHIGQQLDEEDGPEEIFEISTSDYCGVKR